MADDRPAGAVPNLEVAAEAAEAAEAAGAAEAAEAAEAAAAAGAGAAAAGAGAAAAGAGAGRASARAQLSWWLARPAHAASDFFDPLGFVQGVVRLGGGLGKGRP